MRNFLLFFSLVLLLGACELFPEAEPENTLPPITQVGANTFGCKVNGEVWLPNRDDWGSSPLKWEATNNHMFLYPFNSTHRNYAGVNVRLRLDSLATIPIQEGKTYFFDSTDEGGFDWTKGEVITQYSNCEYGDKGGHRMGWIRITKYDPLARQSKRGIISGEFEFTAFPPEEYQEYCDTLTQPIHVTEGRFDILTLKR